MVNPKTVKVIVFLQFFKIVDININYRFVILTCFKENKVIRRLAIKVCKVCNILAFKIKMLEHWIITRVRHSVKNRCSARAPSPSRSRPETFFYQKLYCFALIFYIVFFNVFVLFKVINPCNKLFCTVVYFYLVFFFHHFI